MVVFENPTPPPELSADELETMLTMSRQRGIIDRDEQQLLRHVFELGQIRDSSNEDDDETLDDEGAAGLDVASFMHRAPLAVQADFPATRVYSVFTTLALRHLTVTDAGNRVLGIITRKDVMAAVDGAH